MQTELANEYEEERIHSVHDKLLSITDSTKSYPLQWLIKYYPSFYFQNGRCGVYLTFITNLFSGFSVVWILILLGFVLFDTGDLSGLSWYYKGTAIIWSLWFLLVLIDRIICLSYFAVKYDKLWDTVNTEMNYFLEEKKHINRRLILISIVWLIPTIIACIYSLFLPVYGSIFGIDFSYFAVLVIFQLTFHIPAILSQFIMSVVMLHPFSFLKRFNTLLLQFENNNENHINISHYLPAIKQMNEQCRWIGPRVSVVILYTSLELWLFLFHAIVTNEEPGLYEIYMTCHTLFTSLPIFEFMWFASKIWKLYQQALDESIRMLNIEKNKERRESLNALIITLKHKPMVFYLFRIEVSLRNCAWGAFVFVFSKFLLYVIMFVSNYH